MVDDKPGSIATRTLGRAEYAYWLYDQISCTNFAIIASLTQKLDVETLRRVAGNFCDQHPLLHASCGRAKGGRVAFRTGRRTEVKVVERSGSADDIKSEVEEQLNVRFNGQACPLFRVSYWSDGGDHPPTLVFTFHHGFTDATPAALFVKDVVGAAVNSIAPGSHKYNEPAPPVERLVPRRCRGVLGLARFFRFRLGDTLINRGLQAPQQPPVVRPFVDKERTNHIVSFAIEGGHYDALLDMCKRERTTVQGAVCAAQLIAIREEFPQDGCVPLAVYSAVNLRPYLTRNVVRREFGLHIALVPTLHAIDRQISMWELARQVKSQLDRHLRQGRAHLLWRFFPPKALLAPNRKGALSVEKLCRSSFSGSVVTNLGRIEEAVSSGGATGLTSLGLAMAAGRYEPLCTGVSSMGRTLIANCTYNLNLVDQGYADRITGRIVAFLRNGPETPVVRCSRRKL